MIIHYYHSFEAKNTSETSKNYIIIKYNSSVTLQNGKNMTNIYA